MAFCTHCRRSVYTGLSGVYASTTCVMPAGRELARREVGSEAGARGALGGWAGAVQGEGQGRSPRVPVRGGACVCARAGKGVSVCWGRGAGSVSTSLTAKGCDRFSDSWSYLKSLLNHVY